MIKLVYRLLHVLSTWRQLYIAEQKNVRFLLKENQRLCDQNQKLDDLNQRLANRLVKLD